MDIPTTGNDLLIGDNTDEIIHALAGNDIIDGKDGNDQLFGDEGDDTFLFTGAWNDQDIIDGGADVDTLDFSGVDYSLFVGDPGDTASGFIYADLTSGKFGISVNFEPSGLFFAPASATVTNVENVIGSSGNDIITGDAKANRITGGFGNDKLSGGAGDDTFIMSGLYFDSDTVDGGANTDTLDLSGVDLSSLIPADPDSTFSGGSFVNLAAGNFGTNYQITFPGGWFAFGSFSKISNVENVIGTKYDDTITGNALANVIEGGAGNDTMDGGSGNDVFKFSGEYLDADIVKGGTGIDTLDLSGTDFSGVTAKYGAGWTGFLSVDLTAGTFGGTLEFSTIGAFIRFGSGSTVTGVENILGSAGNDRLKGNSAVNRIEGGDGNDLIDSGGGADALLGGKGNDVYIVFDGSAKITENSGEGIDLVRTLASGVTLAANVENLEITGRTATAFKGTGNALDNVISGLLTPSGKQASFKLNGDAGDDTLLGNNGADELNGGTGNDKMVGGAGNDLYAVDSFDDEIVELKDGGTDTVVVVDLNGYELGTNLENLLLVVSPGIADGDYAATGNELDNLMAGTAQDTGIRLFGLGGNDQLRGANLATTGDRLDGGEGNDKLFGQAGNDFLIGGAGNDLLDGGAGNDTADYSSALSGITVDMSKVVEGLGGEALGDDFVSIENVTGSGFADTITGNSAANILRGGDGADILSGGAGKDTLDGGFGDDTLFADNLDTLVGSAGWDMVYATSGTVAAGFKFSFAGTNIEYAAGNAGKDVFDASSNTAKDFAIEIVGNAGNDTLLGGSGYEFFWGGQGTDTFVIAGDRADYTITEDTGLGPWAGWTYIEKIGEPNHGDWIISVETLKFADQTIAAPTAYVVFNGTAGIDNRTGTDARDEMYGGAGNDILSGGGGTDILNGGAGKDTLSGGEGNDALFIDNSDIVSGGGGYDTAYADDSLGPIGLNFAVGSTGIEEVWGGRGADLIDASGVPDIGSGIGVVLYGNAGNDTLIGSAFDDFIEGGVGDDTLTGGGGKDTFAFNFDNPAGGRDTITDFADGADKLSIWNPNTETYVAYTDVTVADSGGGAVVTFGSIQIVLQGITAAQINQNDFVP